MKKITLRMNWCQISWGISLFQTIHPIFFVNLSKKMKNANKPILIKVKKVFLIISFCHLKIKQGEKS